MITNSSSLSDWPGLKYRATTGYTTLQELHTKLLNGQLNRLENGDCIKAYRQFYLTNRQNLILVMDETPLSQTYWYVNMRNVFGYQSTNCVPNAYSWICDGDSDITCVSGNTAPCSERVDKIDVDNWIPFPQDPRVRYCLSEPVEERCTLQFTAQLAYVVIALNLCKALVLLYILLTITENPLTTVGDAVSSFMTQCDTTTKNLCLMGKEGRYDWRWSPQRSPQIFGGRQHLWYHSVNTRRRVVSLLL
jgi:hypothetical protein